MFFVIVACLPVLCGCTKSAAPDYDRLESQLLYDVCDALSEADADRAASLLRRYLDVEPDSQFARLALAHERERRIVEELSAALRRGDLPAVRRVFASAASDGDSYKILSAVAGLPAALSALQTYLEARPFATSETMRAAQARVEEHLSVLNRSPSFHSFWREEQAVLETLAARETALAMEQLVCQLDATAVSGDLPSDLLLAHLGAAAPDHPVYLANTYVTSGDWAAFRDMALATLDSGQDFSALEIACCLHWLSLSERERRVVGGLFSRGEPSSLSGAVLHAWQAAMEGRYANAVRRLRGLVGILAPRAALIDGFLTQCVLPATQLNAWCWRSPAPGVVDFLGRIEQLKAHDPLERER
jgi:hypothetical protein